eukprot:13427556-Alexandrium_andersonii.AAC.1
MPHRSIHPRDAQRLLRAREAPRGRRRWVLVEKARPARQLGLVGLDHELHVDSRLLESAPHLALAHAAVIDVL